MPGLSPPFPPLLVAALLVAAAVWSARSIWRSRTLAGRRNRTIALVLRLAALALIGAVLANPSQVLSQKGDAARRRFAVLVDRSRSMSGARAALADEVVGALFAAPALTGRLDLLGFGSKVAPLTQSGTADDESRLGQAVLHTLSGAGAGPPAALVVVSDGRTTDPDKTAGMVRALVDSGVPVCAVPAEAPFAGPPNLRVVSTDHDRNLRPGETFQLRAAFTSSDPGLSQATARVLDERGQELARMPLRLSRGRAFGSVALTSPSLNSEWRLEVEPTPGETYLEDNRASIGLTPTQASLRVLYMEGSPESLNDPETGEYTPVRLFLPRAWKAAGIEVDTYGITEQTADQQNLYRLSDGRRGFCRSPEELQSYDVVICSDINLANFSQEQLEWVRRWVAEKGGGFMMVGGITSFADGGWHRTAWEKLVPFNMTGGPASPSTLSASFAAFTLRFDLEAGGRHPVLQISDDPQENRRILAGGVYLGGLNHVRSLKPGATALGWHPDIPDLPVLAVQSYGRGRTLGFTSDAAGGWGHTMMTTWGPTGGPSRNDHYRKLWVNAVRWLGKNHLRGPSTAVELKPSAIHVDAGEPLRFTARLLDLPDEAVSRASLDLGGGRSVPMTRAAPRLWSAETTLTAAKTGPLEVVAILRDAGGREVARSSARVHVRVVSPELRDTRPDPALMATLARVSGGQVCRSGAEARAFLQQRLTSEAPADDRPLGIPRWDRAWLLALLLGLLCAEWTWRRLRAG